MKPTNDPIYEHDAEEAIAGAALIDNSLFVTIDIQPGDMYLEPIRALWLEGQRLFMDGQHVDSITLSDETLEKLGGAFGISKLINQCPSHAYADNYADKIRSAAEQRRMLKAADWLARAAHQDDVDVRRDMMGKVNRYLHGVESRGSSASLDVMTADHILETKWPEPVWAIQDMLPAGLAILAGKPKLGKSWLALQMAQSVATGGRVFGEPIKQGRILYLALEDPPRRLKERMIKQNWGVGTSQADFITIGGFSQQVGDLCNGGGIRLAQQIKTYSYKMVVIDTLSRSVSGDQKDERDMTNALTPLQEMAHENNCVVMLIDHHRKGFGTTPDAIGDILGSTAKGAMADCIWGLYRERGKADANLSIVGRDVEEKTLSIRMDWMTGCWQLEGRADGLEMTDRRREIITALNELGPSQLMEIVDAIGQDKGNTYRRLQDLVNAGYIRMSLDGLYESTGRL